MSLLQCDQCKNILKDPVFIPCGYSICKRHIEESQSTSNKTPCQLCDKVHQESFVVNQKVSRLLEILNRTKANLANLSDKSSDYERLKQNPNDFVNARFDDLKSQIEKERDRIVEFVRGRVELESEKCISDVENHRKRCLNRLMNEPPLNDDNLEIEINSKVAKSNELLVSNKILEDIWDDINKETNLMYEELTAKITALQESYMGDCLYRFEPKFDYNKQIDFGRVFIEQPKANGAHIETIRSNNILPTIQREKSKSPNPTANQSQSEIEVIQSEQVSPNNQQETVKTPQKHQQIDSQTNNECISVPIAITTATTRVMKFAARKLTSSYKRLNGSVNNSAAISRNKSQPIQARRFKKLLGHTSFVYCICFDRTGEYIFTGSDDKLVKMWRAKDGMLVYTLRGHTKEVGDLDINYENTILASGGNDKKVMCWNVKTAQLIYVNTHHILNVSIVKFSPYCQDSSRWLISTGNDGFLFFLKYTQNQNSSTYDFDKPVKFQLDSKIFCSSFSKGGNFLAIGTKEKLIYIYYILKTHPILISKFPGHHLEVNSINFSNRSLSFMSGSNDGTAKVWQIKEKKWTLSLEIELKSYCTEAVWNCDDSLLITAQRANKVVENPCIQIWTPSGVLKHTLNFHKRIIFNIKPHPTDPKLLLSASLDGYVVLWDIFTGQRIFTYYNEVKIDNEEKDGGICNAKWSPNKAELFASSDSHGHLSIFGFGSSTPEPYSLTPSQLFFHNDYDPVCKRKDQTTNLNSTLVEKDSKEEKKLVDKRTKIPPNLMPYGYLTDSMLNPLSLKAQRLVPTHENLSKKQFEKLLVPKPNGSDGQFVIDDGLGEIDFVSDNLSHKNLIQPLSESLLKESETFRLEYSAKEDEIFKVEFADLLKDVEINSSKKRRERIESSEMSFLIDQLYSSSSSLDSMSKPSKRKTMTICEDDLIN